MAIPNTIVTNHHIGTTTEDITTSIDVEDFPFLADMMNGLYSDPIAAVLREYPTNAWDSHVEAGVTRPIEVTLPTPFAPQLVIRDFGLGLSVNDLRDVYSKYGRSLKRESNNVAGQLGMGCKSALSYAPSFTINAVKGGVRVVAIFTKNEQGLGVIKVLDTSGTDDPNGVTITIPVENHDIRTFTYSAENIFRFWEPGTILVNGKRPEAPDFLANALWLDTERTTCLVTMNELDSSYVIMGNVAYPVEDANQADGNGRTTIYRFVSRLNIGDVDFVPSREDVKYTSRTKATLSDLNDYIFSSVGQAFAKELGAVATPWDEAKLKMLWAVKAYGVRGVELRSHGDAPIWTYNPSPAYGRRAAQSHHRIDLEQLLSETLTVITGFPSKTVSGDARARIRTYAPADNYLVLTTGVTGVTMLEGRKNVHRYADILEATKAEKRQAKADGTRAPKVETLYTVKHGPNLSTRTSMTIKELATLAADPDAVMLYLPTNKASMGYVPDNDEDNVYVVCLYSERQIDRLLRFVPGARRYSAQVNIWRAETEAALTDEDAIQHHARNRMARTFSSLPADKVDDPQLAKFIALHKAPVTSTLKAALTLGVTIPEPPAGKRVPDFSRRYPLLGNCYSLNDIMLDEAILYINAKVAAKAAAEAETEEAAA